MFECHITGQVKDAKVLELIARAEHWKTSEIKRDPVLGDDSYFYLTSHDTNLTKMMGRMNSVTAQMNAAGCKVIREKIEVIIYDTKRKS